MSLCPFLWNLRVVTLCSFRSYCVTDTILSGKFLICTSIIFGFLTVLKFVSGDSMKSSGFSDTRKTDFDHCNGIFAMESDRLYVTFTNNNVFEIEVLYFTAKISHQWFSLSLIQICGGYFLD